MVMSVLKGQLGRPKRPASCIIVKPHQSALGTTESNMHSIVTALLSLFLPEAIHTSCMSLLATLVNFCKSISTLSHAEPKIHETQCGAEPRFYSNFEYL